MPQRFLCIICMKVLKDARLTECCGQNFCDSCLTHWLSMRKQKTCPHCQRGNVVHILNKERSREVNELRIRCIHHKEGCGWVGELAALKRHLKSENGCDYVEVTCPYSSRSCDKTRRKDLKTHMNECKHRPYKCEHCNHQGTYQAITVGTSAKYMGWWDFSRRSHYDICPEYPLPCPNKCDVKKIKRKDMNGHHKSCPLEPLACPFKDAGCTVRIARKDMDSHMERNTQQHILKLFLSHQELKARVEQLEKSRK